MKYLKQMQKLFDDYLINKYFKCVDEEYSLNKCKVYKKYLFSPEKLIHDENYLLKHLKYFGNLEDSDFKKSVEYFKNNLTFNEKIELIAKNYRSSNKVFLINNIFDFDNLTLHQKLILHNSFSVKYFDFNYGHDLCLFTIDDLIKLEKPIYINKYNEFMIFQNILPFDKVKKYLNLFSDDTCKHIKVKVDKIDEYKYLNSLKNKYDKLYFEFHTENINVFKKYNNFIFLVNEKNEHEYIQFLLENKEKYSRKLVKVFDKLTNTEKINVIIKVDYFNNYEHREFIPVIYDNWNEIKKHPNIVEKLLNKNMFGSENYFLSNYEKLDDDIIRRIILRNSVKLKTYKNKLEEILNNK